MLAEILGELLRHALGQRGDEHALVFFHAQADLGHQVVHLGRGGPHDDLRIDEPGRTGNLLDDLPRFAVLVFRRRRRDEHGLAHHAFELVEAQRPVVERRGQAKPVVDEVFLARAIALVHAAELADRDVALVDDHQRVVREIVDERRRRLAWLAAGEMPGVVLDAFAEAELGEHLEIEARALLDALRFDQLARILEELDPLPELDLDRFDRSQRRLARRHVMARRVHGEARHRVQHAPRERVEHFEPLDLVVGERDADRVLGVLGREHVDHVAAHPERAAAEVQLAAVVLHRHEARDHVALRDFLAVAQVQDHAVVLGRIADAVDRRHRGHDHHVAPLHERLRRRWPKGASARCAR